MAEAASFHPEPITPMPIFELTDSSISALSETTFSHLQIQERRDLQRVLRQNISVIAPDTLVIAEEFGHWDGSQRRIDLLGLDRDANLVVIELKRTEDGGYMELQALRYAAMVSTMTFEQTVDEFRRFLQANNADADNAERMILDFLGWDEADQDAFAQDVRIVLASSDFSRELTTSVLWLIGRDIDIRCVRLQPYQMEGRILVDVQQIIPLPEAAEYQIRVREKQQSERKNRENSRERTLYDLTLGGEEVLRLPKRKAIYQLFRFLVAKGISPERIAEQCGRRANRALFVVDGEVGHDEFVRLARAQRASGGRSFDHIRYFCEDDELVRLNGKTYAFLNQWGGEVWMQAMESLVEEFASLDIGFTAAG